MSAKDTTEVIKNIMDAIQACFTVLAILVGAFWTWLLFVKKRQNYPRAKLSHSITHRPLTENKVLLHVTVTISNTGDLVLEFTEGTISVLQLLPLWHVIEDTIGRGEDPVPEGAMEITWPAPDEAMPRKIRWPKGELEIEPGDSQDIHCDFILDACVQTVEVYTHFPNIRKRKIGWNLITIYDLQFSHQQPSKEINQ